MTLFNSQIHRDLFRCVQQLLGPLSNFDDRQNDQYNTNEDATSLDQTGEVKSQAWFIRLIATNTDWAFRSIFLQIMHVRCL